MKMEFLKMLNKNICRPFLASLTCLTLIACGGGSTDEAATVVTAPTSEQLMASYSGMTESAALTEDEIYPLLNYLIEGDTAGFEQHKAQMQEDAHDVLSSLNQPKAMASYSENCAYTGKLTISGNYNSTTFPINVTYNYQNCKNSSYEGTLSGKITYIYRAADENYEPTDFSIIYTNYRQQLSTNEFTELHGSSEYIETSSCRSSFVSNLLVTTPEINVLEKDLTTNVNDCLYDNKLDISGRLYLSYLGYVDISSDGQLIIDEQDQISSGLLTISNEQSTINIETTDSTSNVTVDSDNDGSYEFEINSPSWHFTKQPYDEIADDDNDGYSNADDAFPNDPERYEPLTVTKNDITLTTVLGSSEFQYAFTISGMKIDWSLSSDDEWLLLREVSGVSYERVNIGTSNLGLGQHQTKLTLTNEIDGTTQEINVTVNVIEPTLSLHANIKAVEWTISEVEIDLAKGWEQVTQEFAISLNTGTNSYDISYESADFESDFLEIEVEDGVSSSLISAKLHINPDQLNGDKLTGVVNITANVLGVKVSQQLNLTIITPERQLLVPQAGIAFAKFPNVNKLTSQVAIIDNYGAGNTEWMANTESSWLEISASGNTSEKLVIVADPTGLDVDTFYNATITVSPKDPLIKNTQTINVGLWIGSTDPIANASLELTYTNLTADPVRPYVYVNNSGTDIDVYNVYTQELVSTITEVGASLGDMEVSADGERLFVADTDSNEVHIVDINKKELRLSWSIMETDSLDEGFTLSVTNNKELLISGFGHIYNAKSGEFYPVEIYDSYWRFDFSYSDASLYGNRFCLINSGLSPNTILCYNLGFSYIENKLVVSKVLEISTGSNGQDITLNHDGTIAYTASGYPYTFVPIEIDTMTVLDSLPAEAYPSAVEIGPDNAVHGVANGLWVYEAENSLRNSSAYPSSAFQGALVVSSDGYVSIALASSSLFFISSY